MIVSASRRTDIPALHADWLRKRLAEGFALSVNPFNPNSVKLVSLTPADMDALVLWTRDPSPLLGDLPEWEAKGIRSYWLVTITGYPKYLEPNAPDTDHAVNALLKLSALVGKNRVAWRYDPIIAGIGMDGQFHATNFENLARRLKNHVHRVIISVYQHYTFTQKRLQSFYPDYEEAAKSAGKVLEICTNFGLAVNSCATGLEGVAPGACIDGAHFERLWGLRAARDKSQRKACLCAKAVDIGVYDTCTHGCLYCYASRKQNPGNLECLSNPTT